MFQKNINVANPESSYLQCFLPDNLGIARVHLNLKFQTSGSKQNKEGAKKVEERLSDGLSSGSSNTDTMYPPLDPNTKISIPRPVLFSERLVLHHTLFWKKFSENRSKR